MEIKSYFEWSQLSVVFADFGNITAFNEGSPMYSSPIKLYSGVTNPIKIRCLDSDQKRVNVSNITIQTALFEASTNNVLASNIATAVDSANGKMMTTYTASQLSSLPSGLYELGMTGVDANAVVYPIFMDDAHSTRLVVELCPGPISANTAPVDLQWTTLGNTYVTTQAIDLSHRPLNSSLATACIDLNNYTGNIIAQGASITNPTDSDYANVSMVNYANTSGLVLQNISGAFQTIRLMMDNTSNITAVSDVVTGGNIRL